MKRLILICLLFGSMNGFSQNACEPLVYRDLTGVHAAATFGTGGLGPINFSGFNAYEPDQQSCSPLIYPAFCVAGKDSAGQIYASGQLYDNFDTDFYTGVIRSGGNDYDCDAGFIYTSAPPQSRQEMNINNFEVMCLHASGYDIYNVITGAVTTHFSLVPRTLGKALLLPGGKVLVYGESISSPVLPLVIIDVNTHTEVMGPTPINRLSGSEAIVLADGRVLLSGGFGAEIFDPVSMQCTAVPAPNYLNFHSKMGLLPDGRVIKFCGGGLNGLPPNNTVEFFDPVAMSWTVAAPALGGRGLFDLVTLGNGRFLLAGGIYNGYTLEIYDALSQSSAGYGNFPSPPRETKAVLLSNGEVLIWGHALYDEDVMHIFNTGTNTFRDFEVVNNPGFDPTGALLPDGTVFMKVGGNKHAIFDPGSGAFLNLYRYHNLWKVSRAERNAFLNDVQNGSLDFTQYPEIQTWPGNGLHWLGEETDLASFDDLNQNGYYEPLAGESPCLPGDQNLWWTFHDQGDHGASLGIPMNVQVEATAYTFDCDIAPCPDTVMKNTIFLHYEVVNRSPLDYEEVYLGLFSSWRAVYDNSRMFLGCDSALNLAFQYGSDTATYCGGFAPIATGILFLNDGQSQAMDHFIVSEQQMLPQYDLHYYQLMRSIWTDGNHLVNNGTNGDPTQAPGPATNYQYSGDPGACGPPNGWTMNTALPFQTITTQSAGPFNLPASGRLSFDYAVLWTQNTDNLSSLCDLKESSAAISSWWQQQNWDCFNQLITWRPETASSEIVFYPNPAQDAVTIELPAGMHQVRLADLSGQVLRELNLQEGAQMVSLQGLASGLYLLEVDGRAARLAVVR